MYHQTTATAEELLQYLSYFSDSAWCAPLRPSTMCHCGGIALVTGKWSALIFNPEILLHALGAEHCCAAHALEPHTDCSLYLGPFVSGSVAQPCGHS